MAVQPSISEDAEQDEEALAGARKGTKPVLVAEDAAAETSEQSAGSSTVLDRHQLADLPEGMKPFLVTGKITEDSLKRHLQPPDPTDDALAGARKRTKPVLVAEDAAAETSEQSAGSSTVLDRHQLADLPEGMKPFLVTGKITEDSLRRNVKPAVQKDKKGLADRFASWLRQRRSQRAGASG